MSFARKKSADRSPDTRIGFINVLKPSGMTSHDVVFKARSILNVKQVGHAGTLDRLATGVLPIAVGKACRLIRFLDTNKIYRAEILLGQRTTTDDIEGEVITPAGFLQHDTANGVLPSVAEILAVLSCFEGEQDQLPPSFSAIHHEGKRLYQLALANQMPSDLRTRRVAIYRIEFLGLEADTLHIRVWCAGGTYIRALARDMGDKLGCGACIKALSRERSGPFDLSEALSLVDLEQSIRENKLADIIIEPAFVLDLPKVTVNQDQLARIQHGQRLGDLASSLNLSEAGGTQSYIALLYEDKVVAICSRNSDNKLQPEVVL